MNLKTTTLILLLAFTLQNCNKKETSFHHETKNLAITLNYAGADSAILSIVNQLNNTAFLSKMQLEVSGDSKPELNRLIWFNHLGDSLYYMLVPFINKQEMLISYLRVGISQKTVKEVDRINYEADYITGNDSVNKIRRGVELLALNKSGIKLPESFSAKVVNNAIEKENIDFKEAYKKKQKHVAARSDQQCTSFITCDFFTYCDPALVNTMIMEEFRVRLAALSTGAAVSGFGQVIVTGPSDIVGVAPGILNEAINFVSAVSGCDISVLNLMVTSDCVSSDGGGGTTPEIPCETACNDALNALQSGAEVVAEILPAEVIEAGSAFTKPKNPRWTALKNLTWRYESQEEGVVKLIDVSKDIWQWESLKHDKLVFVGTVSGGDVNVSSQTGTASFTPGTPNIQYAGMNLRFEIRYSTVCDCLPGKTNTVTIPYVSNAVFDANPKHDQ